MPRGRPARQRARIVAYVNDVIDRDGIAPSYGMICQELGIATRQEVSRIVSDCERVGIFRRVGKGRVRRIRLAVDYLIC